MIGWTCDLLDILTECQAGRGITAGSISCELMLRAACGFTVVCEHVPLCVSAFMCLCVSRKGDICGFSEWNIRCV